MPEDYPVGELLDDMMFVIQEAMVYIIPAAILAGVVSFIVVWFMYVLRSLSDWTFGSRR